ncbi:hypothetical protein V490_01795 [Pseudogymnoascus sp. VKM F-3557]|nr:hypothetical protein V490_01795 [Pseudogymnoascus sp. VKM F-3557]
MLPVKHIKCDELRPVCQKCQDSKKQCIYQGVPGGSQSAEVTDSLMWPDAIELSCNTWKESGRPPFPRLALAASPSWHSMPLTDLRYIYHMALVDGMLDMSGTSNMCLLWGEIRIMIQLAISFNFVAHTLAATSAERLSVLTKSQEAANDSARYRALALNGLGHEIQSFSRQNADAILSSYLGLSFIMSDHRSLITVTTSIDLVVARMRHWSEQSMFHYLFEYDRVHRSTNMETAPMDALIMTGAPGHAIANLLTEGVDALNKLSQCLQHDLDLAAVIRQLRDVMRLVHDQLDAQTPTTAQYRLIYPFISWYNKNAASSYIKISEKDPAVLIFLLHMYAAFISLAVALPDTNLPLFTTFRFRAIVEINRALEQSQGLHCLGCNTLHYYNELSGFPLHALQVYQSHTTV